MGLDLRIFRTAWRWGRQIGVCPAQDFPMPTMKVRPTRTRYTPTAEEVRQVLDALKGWPRLALLLLASTGARMGRGRTPALARCRPGRRLDPLRGQDQP